MPEALRRGADLVITNGLPGEEMESVPVAQLPVWAYAPPDHPLAGLDTVDVVDLLRHPVIGVPTESTGRQAFDAALLRAGLALRYRVEASSGPVAQALAAAGRGVAVVTDDPRFGLRGLRIVAGADPVCIRLFASWRPDHPGRLQLAQIAHRLQDFTAEQYGEGTRPAGVRTRNT